MTTVTTATVADGVGVRSWGLQVVAGEDGLHRHVTWAHVFDVPEPSEWLDGGEFVIMTGGHIPTDAASQVDFIRRLHDRNASALALGSRASALTPEAVTAANELSFPVISVPRETGYLPIVKFFAAANGSSVQRSLANAVRIYETLAPSQGELDGVTRMRRIEQISGFRLTIVSRHGSALLDGLDDVDEQLMPDVLATDSESGRWASLAIPGGFASPLRVGRRLAGFLVAFEPEGGSSSGLSMFRTIETVARLEVSSLYRDREARRRRGAEALTRALHGVATGLRLRNAAAGGDSDLVLAAIKPASSASLDLEVDSEVHHHLADHGIKHLLVVEGDRTVVALQAASIEVLAQVADEIPVHIGLSGERPTLGDAAIALREALWALEYGKPVPGTAVREYSVDDPEWTQWLPSDPGALSQLVERTLGPVIKYDQDRRGDLLLSLKAYFETDGRLQTTADRLHIHKHTLAYRLRRIEELTGRKMTSAGDRAQFWLALSAHAIVGDD